MLKTLWTPLISPRTHKPFFFLDCCYGTHCHSTYKLGVFFCFFFYCEIYGFEFLLEVFVTQLIEYITTENEDIGTLYLQNDL